MPRCSWIKHVTAIRRLSSTHRLPQAQNAHYPSPRRGAAHKPVSAASSAFARSRALPWVLSSLVAGGIAFYGGALLVEAQRPCHNPAVADVSLQKDVSGRYDDTAGSFDSEVGFSEILMGINRMRKQLAKKCTGHVLEISCGTGRNLGYYDITREGSIESLTFVDRSSQMIEVCRKKWDVLFGTTPESTKPRGKTNVKPGLVVRFLTASALDPMPSPPIKEKYDTVVQTMGLCSTPSPNELLTSMTKHLDTSNPEARILLLEHGRSYSPWMNNILDNSAEKHAEIHGCWFNRDIGSIVEEAARQTGLQVVSEERHHLGTTWVYELRPSPELVKESKLAVAPTSQQPQQTAWRSWLGFP